MTDHLPPGVRDAAEPGTAGAVVAPTPSLPQAPGRPRRYLAVRWKLAISLAVALGWFSLSVALGMPWFHELGEAYGWFVASGIILAIALIPGMANAFVVSGLLLDHRPDLRRPDVWPGLSILIAAFNEEDSIRETLESLTRQRYEGEVQVIVIDDGSTDGTAAIVRAALQELPWPPHFHAELLQMPHNGGKARALTAGLDQTRHDLVITLDADTMVFRDALTRIVCNQLSSPPNTAATAGTVLVRNSRRNLLTRLQEWDYFLGIAVVKRVQSLLQGTLVAQGAFSLFRRDVLRAVGGWPETVGEDIVLTWAILERGYRVGYAEDAFVFTNVPHTLGSYFRQRKRWSRGLIEAFKRHPAMLVKRRLNTPFVYYNLLFPVMDTAYLFIFLPGLVAALFFQNYAVVGLMTLMVLPLAVLVNVLMYLKQLAIFRRNGLVVRRNILGAILFTLGYQAMLAPPSLAGYLSEALGTRKKW
ncbi:MAG TPA: glycosyltransferase [Moraxellaceae bacterium]|nr:glycosyltransferase [Moraxellaceae bacterium]